MGAWKERLWIRRHAIALVLIVAVALALRLPNLQSVPGWDWDEGYNLNFGWHLSEGRIESFSLKYTFIPHPPLYLLAMAGIVKMFGYSILAARLMAVAISIGVLIMIFLCGERIAGRLLGLAAAAVYAFYPAAIYWGRISNGNNLLSLFIMLSLYSFIRYRRSGGNWWAPACVFASCAAMTEYTGLAVVLPLAVFFALKERSKLARGYAIMFAPLLCLFLFTLYVRGGIFTDDIAYELVRFHFIGGGILRAAGLAFAGAIAVYAAYMLLPMLRRLIEGESALLFQDSGFCWDVLTPFTLVAVNAYLEYSLIFPFDFDGIFGGSDYFWAGAAGAIMLGAGEWSIIMYALPLFALILFIFRVDHMLIPAYPFFCLGVAWMLIKAYESIMRLAARMRFNVPAAAAVVLLCAPLAFTAYYDVAAFSLGGFDDRENVTQAFEAVDQANRVVAPGDLVITTSQISGLIKVRTTLLSHAIAYDGRGYSYYRANLSREVFTQNCSVTNADYVVMPKEHFTELEKAGFKDVADYIRGWEPVWSNGEYVILRNPHKRGG